MSSIPHHCHHCRASTGMRPSYSKQLIHHMACHCQLRLASFFFLVTENLILSQAHILYTAEQSERLALVWSGECFGNRNGRTVMKFVHLNLLLVLLPLAQEFKFKCELHPVIPDRNLQVAMKKTPKKTWV